MITLTKDRLKEVLTYNPKTGEFIRNKTGKEASSKGIHIDGLTWTPLTLARFWTSSNQLLHRQHHNQKKDRGDSYRINTLRREIALERKTRALIDNL